MAEYIKREDVKTTIRERFNSLADRVEINTIVNMMPHIDIVRCKECIFADGDDIAEMYRCRIVSFPHWNKGEHFCSYGEREGEPQTE